jgi:hypothetical protein
MLCLALGERLGPVRAVEELAPLVRELAVDQAPVRRDVLAAQLIGLTCTAHADAHHGLVDALAALINDDPKVVLPAVAQRLPILTQGAHARFQDDSVQAVFLPVSPDLRAARRSAAATTEVVRERVMARWSLLWHERDWRVRLLAMATCTDAVETTVRPRQGGCTVASSVA